MSEITNMASVLLIENSAIAAEKLGLTRREVAMMLVSAGEFVDRATTEGGQK